MSRSTATLTRPSATLTSEAAITAQVAASIAMRSAARSVSAPVTSGRPGCAKRSMYTSTRSFQVFAAAVSPMAEIAANSTRGVPPHPAHPAHQAPRTTPAAAVSALAHRTSRSAALIARREGARIEALVLGNDVVDREARMRIRGCGITHGAPHIPVAQNRDARFDHLFHRTYWAKGACDALANDLRKPPHLRRYDRHAARERLERAQSKRLVEAGQQKELGAREQRRDGVELAEKIDGAIDAQERRFLFGLRAIRAIADHEENAWHLPLNSREDSHDIAHTLDGPKVRHVKQDALPFTRLLAQHLRVARACVDGGIDEVVDHFHLALIAAERGDRFASQIFGDRREPVRALDRELGDRAERWVLADQRDVRAVQRRDDLHRASRVLEHLASDPRARGVRDRVVCVHQLELVVAHDLVESHREREIVWGILEQRVANDIHLVIEDARGEAAKPERLLVGDEVDFVSASRERDAQLGCNGAGPSIRGIA